MGLAEVNVSALAARVLRVGSACGDCEAAACSPSAGRAASGTTTTAPVLLGSTVVAGSKPSRS